MKIRKLLPLVMLCVMMSGCFTRMGVSINPLYTDDVLFVEPALEGKWVSVDQKGMLSFAVSDSVKYSMNITDLETGKVLPGSFDVHLLRIGEYVLMDWFPQELEPENSFYESHFIALHSFWRVYLDGDTLKLASFDHSRLKEMIESDSLNIKHKVFESEQPSKKDKDGNEIDYVLLTESPEKMQSFVLENIDDVFEPVEKCEFQFYRKR